MSQQETNTNNQVQPYTSTEVRNNIEQFSSMDEITRLATMVRMAQLNAEESLQIARSTLDNFGWTGRQAIAQYMGYLLRHAWQDDPDAKEKGHRDVQAFLRKLFRDSDDDVRSAALDTLLYLEGDEDELLNLLKKFLNDDHWRPRQHAHLLIAKLSEQKHYDLSSLVPMVQQGLNDDDDDVKHAATEALVQLSPEEGLKRLRNINSDSNWRQRQSAGKLLGRFGGKEDLDVIKEFLEDPDGDVREYTLQGYLLWLEKHEAEDFKQKKQETLLHHIKDHHLGVARVAFEGLTDEWETPELAELFLPMIETLYGAGSLRVLPFLQEHAPEQLSQWFDKFDSISNSETKVELAKVMVALEPEDLEDRLEALWSDDDYDVRVFVYNELFSRQKNRRKELSLRALDDPSTSVQEAALEHLDDFGDEQVLADLLERFEGLDTGAQRATFRLAIRYQSPQVGQLAQQVLEHEDWSTRRDMMHELGESGIKNALSIVLDRLENDSDDDVQAAALEAAVKLDPSQLNLMLQRAKHSEYWRVRQRAAECAGEHGNSSVRAQLETFLNDDDSDVVNAAQTAMLRLAPVEERIPLALANLNEDNYSIVEQSARILKEHDDAEVLMETLKELFPILSGSYCNQVLDIVQHHASHRLDEFASLIPDIESSSGRISMIQKLQEMDNIPNRVELWIKLLEDSDSSVRQSCFQALCTHLPFEESLPYIKQALEEYSYTTRKLAVEKLGESNDPQYLPLAKEKIEDSDDDVRIAAMQTCSTLDPDNQAEYSRALLHDSHWKVRQHALDHIANYGDDSDLERIQEMLHDDDNDVRRSALNAAVAIAPKQSSKFAVDCLGDSDSSVSERARELLDQDTELDKVQLAIDKLPHINSYEATEYLMNIIDEQAPHRFAELKAMVTDIASDSVRERIVNAMFEEEEPVAMETLRSLQHDSSGTIRKRIFDELWERLPGERTLLAGEALKDDSWELRLAGVEALKDDPEPALLDDLLPLARDSDYDVRRETLKALAHYQDIRVFGELVSAMDDTNDDVRAAAESSLKKVKKSPFLSRLMQDRTGVPIWVQIRQTVEEVNRWAAQTGQELLGRPVVVNQPNHEKEDNFDENDDTVLRLEISEKPVTWCHPNGEEVMRGMALYKIGHHLCNEGERGFKTMTGIAKSEGIKEVYDLIASERVDRNLRSRRTDWRIPLDHLASYAFSKNVYRIPIEAYAEIAETPPTEVLEAVKTGQLPGRLLPPSKTRNIQLVSLRDRDLLRIPNALPPLMAFLWCLRCGFEAHHHPNPKVGEAIALIPSNLRTLPHSKVLQVAREVAELLGKEDQHKQDMEQMQQKMGRCGGAANRMVGNNLRRLAQTGFLPEWMEQQINQQGNGRSMNVQCRKRRQIVHQRPPRSMQKLAGGQTLNLGPELDYPKLSYERSLEYNRESHSHVVGTIRKHIRRLRSYFERLGRRTIDEYAMRRGHRIDMQMARKASFSKSPNLLVHTTDEIHANLYLGILIDRSGSMEGDKLERAKRFGALVAESARGLRGITGHINAFDDDTFIHLGDFQRNGVAQLDSGGANNDAAALERAAELALSSRKKNRLLVMISDGSPTECSVEALKQLVKKLQRDYGIVCAQVAVESLPEIAFPHYIDLSEYSVEEAVTRFGTLLMRLTSAWR